MKAMGIFQSQIQPFPAARSIGAVDALAKYRGAVVNVNAAEAFVAVREIR